MAAQTINRGCKYFIVAKINNNSNYYLCQTLAPVVGKYLLTSNPIVTIEDCFVSTTYTMCRRREMLGECPRVSFTAEVIINRQTRRSDKDSRSTPIAHNPLASFWNVAPA
jgi:hypothetical protein